MISSGCNGSVFLIESMGAKLGLRFVNEPFTEKHQPPFSSQHDALRTLHSKSKFLAVGFQIAW